ncbi:MAG: putative polymerase ECF-type sigma factor [Bacteroidetes bacterium]|nr:putative polymerase ECF-type sigma factor [Bacteroidota bacterium]
MREYKNDIVSHLGKVEENVVTRSQCRDLAAFEQLVRKYQPYAFSLAMKFLCDEAEASDVVQDSFLRVWKNIDRYDPNQKFTTWLYKIVVNLCVDRFRALKRSRNIFLSRDRDPVMEDLPDERDWETMRSHEQLADIIRTLSGQLSRKQRLVFTLRDLQDLTVDEVAEITGLSIGSIKTNLHYARKSIRDVLVRHYGVVRGDL